ncbi:hypothetical protein WA538_001509 [Blastocystis sp. DL]
MIKQPYIKSVEVIKKGKIDGIVLPAVSFPVIGKREKENEREIRSRQIPKTSPYGNYVFAHLSKFAACQWDGDIIVVNGSVQIVDPYGMENVRGDEKGVKEVKALLEKMK